MRTTSTRTPPNVDSSLASPCLTNTPKAAYSAHTGQSPTQPTNTPYHCMRMSSSFYNSTTHSRTPLNWINTTHYPTYRS